MKLFCFFHHHNYEHLGLYRDGDRYMKLVYSVHRCKNCGKVKKFATYYFGYDSLPTLDSIEGDD